MIDAFYYGLCIGFFLVGIALPWKIINVGRNYLNGKMANRFDDHQRSDFIGNIRTFVSHRK